MMYFVKCVTEDYFNFRGKAKRAELLKFLSACVLLEVLWFVAAFVGFVDFAKFASLVCELFLVVPLCAVVVRRLHDCGFSGIWLLIVILLTAVPYVTLAYYMSGVENLTDEDIQQFLLSGTADFLTESQNRLVQILSVLSGLVLLLFAMVVLLFPSRRRIPGFRRKTAFRNLT